MLIHFFVSQWAGNGFYATKKTLQTTAEGSRMANSQTGRMWSFVNEDKKHYSSKAPVGFKVSRVRMYLSHAVYCQTSNCLTQ